MVLLTLLGIIAPAIIWGLVMFYGEDAPGKPFHSQFSHKDGTVVLFQILKDGQRGQSVVSIVMGCLFVLQVIVTIVLYLKILFTTYMSTTRASLPTQHENDSTDTSEQRSGVAKRKNADNKRCRAWTADGEDIAVSYTHLTLPTKA